MQKRRLLAIFAVVFVDLLGFGLILPLLPYYAETFDASGTMVGLLVASYALAQLVGGPVLGRLSDRFGRRPVLLISILGTLTGFVLLGVAQSLWVLFLSRLIDGLTGGNISVVRAYITDVTDDENRTRGMGLIGAAFGMGFVFGPALGGLLSTGERYALPAFVAATLAALNFIAVYLWLPESLPADRRNRPHSDAAHHRPRFDLTALRTALARPGVRPLLLISLVYGLAFAIFEGVFSLHAQRHLALKSNETGFLLAYVGLLVAFVQGGAIGWLSARYTDQQLLLAGMIGTTGGLVGWAYAPNVWLSALVLAPLSLSLGIMSATIYSALSKTASAEDVGGLMGVSSAIGSLTRAIGPILGGVLLDVLGTWSPGIFSALLMGGLLLYGPRLLSLAAHISPQDAEHEHSHA